jgi:pimeloyl-ACP methyl ester carboxylesterase
LLEYTVTDGENVISSDWAVLRIDLEYVPKIGNYEPRVRGDVVLYRYSPPPSGDKLNGIQIGMSGMADNGKALLENWIDSASRTEVKKLRATATGSKWTMRVVPDCVTSSSVDIAVEGRKAPLSSANVPMCSKDPEAKIVIVFIGGFFDRWLSENVKNVVKDVVKTLPMKPNTEVWYSDWRGVMDDGSSLDTYLRSLPSNVKLRIVGHSYGADTAVDIALRCERQIDRLITIDPVGGQLDSSSWPKVRVPPQPPAPYPAEWKVKISAKLAGARKCTSLWFNVNAEPGNDWDESDGIAYLGGKYGLLVLPYATTFAHATGLHHADFLRMMNWTDRETVISAWDTLLVD